MWAALTGVTEKNRKDPKRSRVPTPLAKRNMFKAVTGTAVASLAKGYALHKRTAYEQSCSVCLLASATTR